MTGAALKGRHEPEVLVLRGKVLRVLGARGPQRLREVAEIVDAPVGKTRHVLETLRAEDACFVAGHHRWALRGHDPIAWRTCSRCGGSGPFEKKRRSALSSWCVTCYREVRRDWKRRHLDRENAKRRAHRHAQGDAYRVAFAAYTREWRKRYPEKAWARDRKRDAIRRGAPHVPYSEREWRDRVEEYGHRCAYCRRHESECGKLTMEHMAPLSRGGADEIGNLVPACGWCNTSKSARSLLEFCFGRFRRAA